MLAPTAITDTTRDIFVASMPKARDAVPATSAASPRSALACSKSTMV
ncbi:MAG: hypothetical protein LBS09_03820 [Bacteroidales bacterium]|nr:hypothetical protein [Bacteroidales bacterium]